MAYKTAIRTQSELVQSMLIDGNMNSVVRHHAYVTVDATAAAVLISLDGQTDHHLSLPPESAIVMKTRLIGWDITNSRPVVLEELVGFQRAANGAITAITLTGRTDISVVPGSETIAWTSDDTTGNLELSFTGAANTDYKINAQTEFVFCGADYRNASLNVLNT